MIEQSGQIVATRGEHARVRVERQGACSSCNARSGCGQRVLSEFDGLAGSSQVWVENALRSQVGDHVLLGIHEQDLLRASVQVYFLPLLGLIGGGIAGTWLFGAAEVLVALTALLAMAAVFLVIRFGTPGRQVSPQILKILPATGMQPVALRFESAKRSFN